MLSCEPSRPKPATPAGRMTAADWPFRPSQDCWNSHTGATTANPRVVNASVRPCRRSAGSPMSAIVAAPTTPAIASSASSDRSCGPSFAVR